MKYLFLCCTVFSSLSWAADKPKMNLDEFFTPLPSNSENPPAEPVHSKTFYCDVCKDMVTAFDKRMHVECDHHQCIDCGAQFESFTQVMNHNMDEHLSSEQLKPHSIKGGPTDQEIIRYKRKDNPREKIRIKFKKIFKRKK